MGREHITMIGAGLAGPVMASYLAELGYSIEIRGQGHVKEIVDHLLKHGVCGIVTVSYTHLRAHETTSDLV